VRQGILSREEANALWDEFSHVPIVYLDFPELRARTWELAEQHGLLTLYDAAFLACTELCPADEPTVREFWTADQRLLADLGARRPGYVCAL
jgi:predicted nucleic acid-binding protein